MSLVRFSNTRSSAKFGRSVVGLVRLPTDVCLFEAGSMVVTVGVRSMLRCDQCLL